MNFNIGVSSETMTQLADLGGKLAKFGITKVEQFYPYLVKQVLIGGWTVVGVILLLFLMTVIGVIIGTIKDSDEWAKACAFMICGIIVFLFVAVADGSIGKILNPEYHATKRLIEFIR